MLTGYNSQEKHYQQMKIKIEKRIQISSFILHLYFNFHIQEADALSRMPTMSNYTDFHEWLNNFIPGIYSDDFTLTPGN